MPITNYNTSETKAHWREIFLGPFGTNEKHREVILLDQWFSRSLVAEAYNSEPCISTRRGSHVRRRRTIPARVHRWGCSDDNEAGDQISVVTDHQRYEWSYRWISDQMTLANVVYATFQFCVRWDSISWKFVGHLVSLNYIVIYRRFNICWGGS